MKSSLGRLKTRGEGNAQTKLTAEQVRFIKLAVYHGASQIILVRHFKVSHVQISRIVNNVDWRHA